MQWANATAYFAAGTFVGYSTLATNGEALPAGNLATVQGLRIGDTLTQAQQFYGSALTTSFAQGGSWSVSTPDGTLDGYLNGEPNEPGAHHHERRGGLGGLPGRLALTQPAGEP